MLTNFSPPGDDASISRSKMPQVDQKDIAELLVFLGKYGVKFSAGVVDPKTVRAKQAVNLNVCKSLSDEVLARPTLLSGDRRVIDGDHRWYAHVLRETLMPFIMLEGLSFEDALKIIFQFPKTYSSDEQNRRVAT